MNKKSREAVAQTGGSQTLDRGLEALELLASTEDPMSINELADELGVHRSSAYRILRTLEQRRFVVRGIDGKIKLGPKLVVLSKAVAPQLIQAAGLPLQTLANSLNMTAFLTVLDGSELITVLNAEPFHAELVVSRKPGTRHSVLVGAPGHAVEAWLGEEQRIELLGAGEVSAPAKEARVRGFALSRDEVMSGVAAVAVPLFIEGEPPASVAVAHFSVPEDTDLVYRSLKRCAEEIMGSYR